MDTDTEMDSDAFFSSRFQPWYRQSRLMCAVVLAQHLSGTLGQMDGMGWDGMAQAGMNLFVEQTEGGVVYV